MIKGLRNWWWEGLCIILYCALAGSQLFKAPITGIADNGDFPRVLGHLSVCDSKDQDRRFLYVYARYRIDPVCQWDSDSTSSELLLPWILKKITVWTGRETFSIQAAGKGHLGVALVALAILLWSLHEKRPRIRFGVPLLVLLIFSDVAYVAYFNSFYTDAASMVFLMLTLSLAVAAELSPRMWVAIAFGLALVLFIAAKTQHAFLGALFALLALRFARRSATKQETRWWMAAAVTGLVLTVFMISTTGVDYKTHAIYNVIFVQLTPQSSDPVETLAELGLPASDAAFVGTHSYLPNAPTADENWEVQFLKQTSGLKLALYYLRHPDTTFDLLWKVMREDGSGIRPSNLANYRQEDGFKPGTLADRFDLWSTMRSQLLLAYPVHILIFYALMICGSLACLFRPNLAANWPLYPMVLVLSIGGVVEFSCAALLDCLENARHLFLFHVITEILIVCAFAAVLIAFRLRRRTV